MRMKTAILVVAMLSSAHVGPAGADTGRFTDPNDTPGRFDVEAVRQGHDGSRLVHSVRTFARWSSRDLSGDESYIGFYLDDGNDGTRGDRFVWVRYKQGRGLYAEVFRPLTHANGDRLGPVRVTRPNGRSVKISLRPSQISPGIADGYRWRVTTSYEKETRGGDCGANRTVSSFPTGRCIDNVPGLRQPGFHHNL